MKSVQAIILVFLLSLSCLPDEDKIVDECLQAAADATAQCEDFYRTEVLPTVIDLIGQLCTSEAVIVVDDYINGLDNQEAMCQ